MISSLADEAVIFSERDILKMGIPISVPFPTSQMPCEKWDVSFPDSNFSLLASHFSSPISHISLLNSNFPLLISEIPLPASDLK